MRDAAYRHAAGPRHARQVILRSPRSWVTAALVTARRLPGYWTRQRAATAAGLLFSTAALITSIVVAVTMQPPPSAVQREAIAPTAAPAASGSSSGSASPPPARHRHTYPARTAPVVPVPAASAPSAAPSSPSPPVIRHGHLEVSPTALFLAGTQIGQLTIRASGGTVRWTASAFDVTLSAWSGTLMAGESTTIIVSAEDPGGTGWVRIQPGGLYIQVTWPPAA